MVININVPNIGEDVLEVTEILIKVGDTVNVNQSLLIIEGDKSSIEVPTPHTGIITKIHIHIGDKVKTGSLIASIKTDDYHCINNSTCLNHPNTITKNTISKFNTSTETAKNDKRKVQQNHISDTSKNNYIFTHATPFIRHMAREFKINLSHIKGSGRKGRILKEDIQNYLKSSKNKIHHDTCITPTNIPNTSSSIAQLETNFCTFGNIKKIPLNKIQKIIGTHLQKNWHDIPHVTQFDIVDITDLENFRKQHNLEIEKQKINNKITMLVFVIKIVSKVLTEFPYFNSSLSQDGHTLILKKYINIGIAVNTKQGLLVPVLKNVDKKGIITLSQELLELSQKAREGNQLTPSDMQGGTFTISNLGGLGGTAFTPIINAPEVAILGMSKSTIHPIWNGKKFIPRLMLPISLSYDHRVINGADGIKFINYISKIISDIRLLSM